MHSAFFALLQNEITKSARRKLPYFGIFAMGLLSLIIYLGAGRLNGGATNGWGYVAFSMQLLFTDLVPVFIINFAALLLAQETGTRSVELTTHLVPGDGSVLTLLANLSSAIGQALGN